MSLFAWTRRLFPPRITRPDDRDLADLGLSRMDYDLLATSQPGARARMEALAARFGITPEMIDADRGMALDLSEVCGHCAEAGACQRALDGKGEFATERCPNAARYAEMSAT